MGFVSGISVSELKNSERHEFLLQEGSVGLI